MTNSYKTKRTNGFTIVELIVIIVVIAILAAITIVSYSAVTQNAKEQTVKTDAQTIATLINKQKADKGSYPATIDELSGVKGVQSTYQYSYNATAETYCVTASVNGASAYIVSGNLDPKEGGCPGHGINGQQPITNIAKNPKGTGAAAAYATSGWFATICSTNAVDVPNVSWNSRTGWHRLSWTGSGCNTMRMNLDLADLENAQTYRVSALVGNSGSSSTTFTMDLADQGTTSFTLNAGQMTTVSFTATRSTYDSTFRFIDINPGTGTGVLITDVIVTKGTTTYQYADGASPNWVWNGTANASTSTGPAL